MLDLGLKTYLKIGAAVVLAVLAFIVFKTVTNHLEEFDRRGTAEANLKTKVAAQEATIQGLKDQQELEDDLREIVRDIGDEVETKQVERRIYNETTRTEIINAPPEDDGNVAPVLDLALDRMYGDEAGSGDQDPDSDDGPGDRPSP